MRSCKSSMDSTTFRAAARALIMKKAAARPKTYISPYHRRAIGPSRIRMGSMSGFGNTRGHPTDVEDSFQVHPAQLRRSEEHTSELQSQSNLVCRLLLEKKKK